VFQKNGPLIPPLCLASLTANAAQLFFEFQVNSFTRKHTLR
jgi:hypothetical protein